nr:immunoglobulin light chain junction region [Macaca mulatta]MOW64332.1 immunoglobulin light chain junction region [Macaca mulatta]MOX48145.1 immunoglobulin light chain junction region [Macaca mulatta]MOX49803.1 immunoglobulin light chain junction region [Macaca mulatta]MOX49823.1 immunoglobulin light chain junction region [Macaca mulatta]
CQQGYDTPYSF